MFNRITPAPGQESVWDYPRPPRLELVNQHIQIFCEDTLVADTRQSYRVLETSHPPVYYLPPNQIKLEYLRPESRRTYCEWKGIARYYTLILKDKVIPQIAWYYAEPTPDFSAIAGYLAFYPSKVSCFVDGEAVRAQAGDFYGGWITPAIVGPFKGEPGTMGW